MAQTPDTEPARSSEASAPPLVLGRFRGLAVPDQESDFVQGGMPTPDGGFWYYREPDAAVIVEHDRLRVRARPLTRSHDRVQFFDNAKHMYFSTHQVRVPESGTLSFEVGLTAHVEKGRDEDLYSGFVSFNLLDFESGVALDWFLSNRKAATVYARLPFTGISPVQPDEPQDRPRWFCVFDEVRQDLSPQVEHRCRIEYEPESGAVTYRFDGDVVGRYDALPARPQRFVVALGMMTEKPIGEHGSVSCFGQGITATYSEVLVEGSPGLV